MPKFGSIVIALLVIVSQAPGLLAQEIPVVFTDPAAELVDDGIDTTNIAGVRALLDESDSPEAPLAALFLVQRGYIDVCPKIRGKITLALASGSPAEILSLPTYLTALYLVRDPQTMPLLQTSLDTMLALRGRRTLYGVSAINSVLTMIVNLKDFSRLSAVIALLGSEDQWRDPGIVKILAAHSASQELRLHVYTEIKRLLTHTQRSFRWVAVRELAKFRDYAETQSALRQQALNDSDYMVREESIVSLFAIYGDHEYVLKACEEMAVSASDTAKFRWSIGWLQYVNSPYALATLERIRNRLPQGYLSQYVSREIESYVPHKPLSARQQQSVVGSLDSLMSYQEQVMYLGWISDQVFVSNLEIYLERARQTLSAGDSVGCARAVRAFQNTIDFVYKDSLNPDPRMVTVEGWKFLYYNAQYIVDRLPAIPPSPVLTSLNPATAYAGGNGFTLTVKGKAFLPTSVVLWNGSLRTTSYVADSILQTTILASDIASPGTASVTVVNPGNDISNTLTFVVKLPPPAVTALAPAMAEAGSGGFTLAVSGLHFVSGSVVTWKGLARTTTFVSASLLRASIPATDIAAAGSALVGVKNPNGSQSNTLMFTIIKTVSMLLDDLRLQLSQSLTKGLIGDANFIKELDNGLDNAKKHLAKPDSVNCYKEVATFRDKVNAEYVKTVDNEKKGKPRDKRFVTLEGWKLLYYGAQGIVDRLPSKK